MNELKNYEIRFVNELGVEIEDPEVIENISNIWDISNIDIPGYVNISREIVGAKIICTYKSMPSLKLSEQWSNLLQSLAGVADVSQPLKWLTEFCEEDPEKWDMAYKEMCRIKIKPVVYENDGFYHIRGCLIYDGKFCHHSKTGAEWYQRIYAYASREYRWKRYKEIEYTEDW